MRFPQVQAGRQVENSASASQRFLTLGSVEGPVFGDMISHHAIFQHLVLTGRLPSTTQLRASDSCLADCLLPVKACKHLTLFCEVLSQDWVPKKCGCGAAGNSGSQILFVWKTDKAS